MRLRTDPVLVLKVFDSLSGPERHDLAAIVLERRQLHMDPLAPGLASQQAMEDDVALCSVCITAFEDDRLCAEDIGNMSGIDILHRETVPVHRDIQQQWI